ncbi:geranylgeranyl pyrophosphate synthase [Metabacillus crassostreae]|uniref:polyprenyl synthetase family protein n=1 Tax=Metabacillus crassostreae TaxID=929098 RepID=UPI0019594FEA|nr:polyprenyl synthetase family protein [Metabacillus crassostreae]MBM7605043.1 geranylgeranyl pyrophosphate synthase [Metabacillus crassostreae]
MNEELVQNADTCYELGEQRAAVYFNSLYEQVTNKTYVSNLTEDFQQWKQNHIRHTSLFSIFSRGRGKPDSNDYHNYIQWLNYTGKLDSYLDRSISYIYMRDLGKALDTPETQDKIRKVVNNLKTRLIDREKKTDFSMAMLYRMAQKDDVEATFIWLMNKLKTVSANIPEGMDAAHAKRKLIKIIAGVILHVNEEMDEDVTPQDRSKQLDVAIRLGYCYGLTYPFIDDLLDAKILSAYEEEQYSRLIRTSLLTGVVPDINEWSGENKELISYIHAELKAAFQYIKDNQHQDTITSFFEQSYIFFQSQEDDRLKHLSDPTYTNEELYIPIILKSSSSRLIIRSVISAKEDEGFDERTFYYGIYNQLADDFADMFDDLDEGAVTPYTYFLTYHDKRSDLINPFELYWAVISNLIHNVYKSDSKTREIILNRAINGLKRYKEKMGKKKYNEVMELFMTGNTNFNDLIQTLVKNADDVDFFDKLLRDHMVTNLRDDQKEQDTFSETIERVRKEINKILPIERIDDESMINDPITAAANYSLKGDGKRLRPIITWIMGVDEYGLDKSAITPLLRSLEYMHTASLIFDDLPSQDNASIRRGHRTLHEVYNIATAELTGLFLTQKAIWEQASLDTFDTKSVLRLIQYSAKTTEDMCKGQIMDLDSKGKPLTEEQLNMLSYYKTGLAFEASLIMPAILANVPTLEIDAMKKFAYHAGIAFQIKDDLLDVEGDSTVLGKIVGKDAENNNSTFVSILGTIGAQKMMWEHYCTAIESLQHIPRSTTFLKHLVNYIVHREK